MAGEQQHGPWPAGGETVCTIDADTGKVYIGTAHAARNITWVIARVPVDSSKAIRTNRSAAGTTQNASGTTVRHTAKHTARTAVGSQEAWTEVVASVRESRRALIGCRPTCSVVDATRLGLWLLLRPRQAFAQSRARLASHCVSPAAACSTSSIKRAKRRW